RRREGGAHAQARQEAADAAAARAAFASADDARGVQARAERRRLGARLHLRHPGRAHGDHGAARRLERCRNQVPGSQHDAKLARGDLREPRQENGMNWYAVRAIYHFEMARMWRTIVQSIVAPVISTSLYFVVFGS